MAQVGVVLQVVVVLQDEAVVEDLDLDKQLVDETLALAAAAVAPSAAVPLAVDRSRLEKVC